MSFNTMWKYSQKAGEAYKAGDMHTAEYWNDLALAEQKKDEDQKAAALKLVLQTSQEIAICDRADRLRLAELADRLHDALAHYKQAGGEL